MIKEKKVLEFLDGAKLAEIPKNTNLLILLDENNDWPDEGVKLVHEWLSDVCGSDALFLVAPRESVRIFEVEPNED